MVDKWLTSFSSCFLLAWITKRRFAAASTLLRRSCASSSVDSAMKVFPSGAGCAVPPLSRKPRSNSCCTSRSRTGPAALRTVFNARRDLLILRISLASSDWRSFTMRRRASIRRAVVLSVCTGARSGRMLQAFSAARNLPSNDSKMWPGSTMASDAQPAATLVQSLIERNATPVRVRPSEPSFV